MGRLLDESGVDLILVGDSVGMVVLGYPDTTLVTMDEMVHHTRAVARGVSRALLVADLPALSYRTPEEAVRNGRRLMDAGAQAVKLEGGTDHVSADRSITGRGIPVVAHLGMLPQSVREEGGTGSRDARRRKRASCSMMAARCKRLVRLPWCWRSSLPGPRGG